MICQTVYGESVVYALHIAVTAHRDGSGTRTVIHVSVVPDDAATLNCNFVLTKFLHVQETTEKKYHVRADFALPE